MAKSEHSLMHLIPDLKWLKFWFKDHIPIWNILWNSIIWAQASFPSLKNHVNYTLFVTKKTNFVVIFKRLAAKKKSKGLMISLISKDFPWLAKRW